MKRADTCAKHTEVCSPESVIFVCILSPFLFASKRLGRLQPQSGLGPFALAKTTDGILARNSQLNLFLLVETSPLISLLQDFYGLDKLPQVQACNSFNYFTSQHIPKDLIIMVMINSIHEACSLTRVTCTDNQ